METNNKPFSSSSDMTDLPIREIVKRVMITTLGSSSSSAAASSPRQSSSINKENLQEDILIEIFLRLPLEPIFKFKCVSKVWLSLLSDPSFVTNWRFLNKSLIPWSLFFDLGRPANSAVSTATLNVLRSQFISDHHGFSFQFLPEEKIFLLASSNGLVLCSNRILCERMYYVCNPLTQKWVSIPQSPSQGDFNRLALPGLISESFSQSSRTSTYKVVRVPLFGSASTNFDLEIFSSDKGEWDTCQVSCPQEVTMDYSFFSPSNVVSRNGILHWIEGRNRIIAYHLNNNENGGHQCKLIDLPEEVEGRHYYRYLGESEGLIVYMQCQNGQFSFWILEDYINAGWFWRLVHKTKTKDILLPENFDVLESPDKLMPLGINPMNQNDVVLGDGINTIFAYNMTTRRLKLLSRRPYRWYNPTKVLQCVIAPWPTTLSHQEGYGVLEEF